MLAALELIMPTQEKDLGFPEWIQHSVFTENKIPCVKKTPKNQQPKPKVGRAHSML